MIRAKKTPTLTTHRAFAILLFSAGALFRNSSTSTVIQGQVFVEVGLSRTAAQTAETEVPFEGDGIFDLQIRSPRDEEEKTKD